MEKCHTDWWVVGGLVFCAVIVALFWAGVGYAISRAFADTPRPDPPGYNCTYSGVIPNPDGNGATSSAVCASVP